MDVPAHPGDVLAQPTRARLFALLGELRRPASTDDLATRMGLHPNGIRIHLERLQEAGLVRRERERLARGRPRDAWTISADGRPGGERPTGYAELSGWLAQSLAARDARPRDIEDSGREIGRGLVQGDAGGPPEQRLHDVLASLGFQPQREPGDGDEITYCLRNCPYRATVRERQPLICGLHRGITLGLLDTIDARLELAAFEPRDPDEAGCRITLRGPIAAAAAEPDP